MYKPAKSEAHWTTESMHRPATHKDNGRTLLNSERTMLRRSLDALDTTVNVQHSQAQMHASEQEVTAHGRQLRSPANAKVMTVGVQRCQSKIGKKGARLYRRSMRAAHGCLHRTTKKI
mmetsp:Transcript_21583/g.36983  ORF Transcript_21583/g.36983 Transcript_21583/m.36983 type:complete len:118 (+) Transcript_21583:238-591(+)